MLVHPMSQALRQSCLTSDLEAQVIVQRDSRLEKVLKILLDSLACHVHDLGNGRGGRICKTIPNTATHSHHLIIREPVIVTAISQALRRWAAGSRGRAGSLLWIRGRTRTIADGTRSVLRTHRVGVEI